MTRLLWVKRKSVAAVVICAVLAAASISYWQMNQSAEAAMVYPHPGLVGWWRFDEGSGTVAGDSSGNGNNGTINGATWVDGKYGKALNFDGVNDQVQVPHDSTLSPNAISVLAWIKRERIGVEEAFVSKYGGDLKEYLFEVDGSNRLTLAIADGSDITYAYATTLLDQTGVWYFVAGTYNGTNLRVFINGADRTSGSPTQESMSHNTGYATIGRASWYDGLFFDGIIDEVRIYNRGLSQAEIQESFQKMPDFSSKLLAKVPKGTTQVIVTLSWQGIGNINATIQSPSKDYAEDAVPVYQKTVYSTSGGSSSMLNIKRLSISTTPLSTDENWYVVLEFDEAEDYRITVEIQK